MSASNEHWVRWHSQYVDPDSPRSRRLATVQRQLRGALDLAPPGEIRLLSMCAGQGRDVLGVLSDHPRAGDVRARLVELSPELAADGRAAIAALGLSGVEMVEGDASSTDVYAEIVPAHVLLVCGVFGHLSKTDIRATLAELPHLGVQGAVSIWTKEGNPPDWREWIRGVFASTGFEEIAYDTEPGTVFGVGSNRWNGKALPFRPGRRIFNFQPVS